MIDDQGNLLSRRAILARAGVLAAVGALAPLPEVAERIGLLGTASASANAIARDTLGGFVAYVVPGSDRYSRAQGRFTSRPGGVAAGAIEALRMTLDVEGTGLAEAAASILNALARPILPGGDMRGFASAFAALSYSRKDQIVRDLVEGRDPTLRVLGTTLPSLVAFLSYSEAGVLDSRTGRLRATPVGWQITGYTGVADIRDEFQGYYGGHRSALRGKASTSGPLGRSSDS
ncbi:MAG TPA: hypothetical protein VLP43_04120 [Solirubrobacteraceae bacterium]|nr:hypothetical protein [Solirubrobacteraceae bacterium]